MEDKTVSKRGPKPNIMTRENLLLAGMKLFHTTGYAATGIKDIVDTAKVPKGSFYNHFQSKEDFGREVVNYYFHSGKTELELILLDERTAPLQRLSNYFTKLIKNFEADNFLKGCLMGNFSAEIADHSETIRIQLTDSFRVWKGYIKICIEDAKSSKQITTSLSTEVLADFILNSWEGSLLRMRAEKSAQALHDFYEVIFKGVLK